MAATICDTIEILLATVQEDIEDPDVVYKLRTARQLNVACKEHQNILETSLEDAHLDEEVRERLQRLGYLNEDA